MTYRFIAVHLKVAMSKTLMGKNQTFVGCPVLVPSSGLDGSEWPCPGWHPGGAGDTWGQPGHQRGQQGKLATGEVLRPCSWVKKVDRHFGSQVGHANPPVP